MVQSAQLSDMEEGDVEAKEENCMFLGVLSRKISFCDSKGGKMS